MQFRAQHMLSNSFVNGEDLAHLTYCKSSSLGSVYRLHKNQDIVQSCPHLLWNNFPLEADGEWMDMKPSKGTLVIDEGHIPEAFASGDC